MAMATRLIVQTVVVMAAFAVALSSGQDSRRSLCNTKKWLCTTDANGDRVASANVEELKKVHNDFSSYTFIIHVFYKKV